MRSLNAGWAWRFKRGGLLGSAAVAALFTGGVQGVFFDPSDRTTLYQDAAGTTPANLPGDPVGLMLDKSKGLVLGPEVVVNGGFDAGLTGWTLGISGSASPSASGGVCYLQGASTEFPYVSQASLVSGKTYRVTFQKVTGATGDAQDCQFRLGTAQVNFGTAAAGTYSFTVVSGGADIIVMKRGVTTTAVGVDNISVRELPGYHATQTVAASRPTLARHPMGGRRNLLTQTEELNTAAWTRPVAGTGVAAVVTPNFALAPDGTMTACRLQLNKGSGTTTSDYSGFQTLASASTQVVASIYIKTADGSSKLVAFKAQAANAGVVVDGNWKRLEVTEANASFYQLILRGTYGTSDDADLLIWHPQLELGSTATPYQRGTTAYDVTEAGVEDLWYLAFDGVDDFLLTPAIDLTYTDKVGVFAGVRQLRQGTSADILAEFSSSTSLTDGSFVLCAQAGAESSALFGVRGTVRVDAKALHGGAPYTAIISGLTDIGAPSVTLRRDGSQIAQNASSLGTGNFGKHLLYIGRRGGTELPFNGNLYGLCVVGKMPNAAEITGTERYLNSKTGAYA